MPEEKSQSSQKPQSRTYFACDAKSAPPPEPVNAAPFATRFGGLTSPPIEPVHASPFTVQPNNQAKAPSKTEKGK
jgi:hypothetical protein